MGHLPNRAPLSTRDTIYNLLQECVRKKDMVLGRPIHSVMVTVGLDSVSVLAEFLIHLYASNGDLKEVDSVFSNISEPSSHTWQAIISSHVKLGAHKKALLIYHDMISKHSAVPNRFIYLCALKACFSFETFHEGMHIHGQIVKNGLDIHDVVLATMLVDMYGKSGKLMEAHSVFVHCMQYDAILYGALISGYVQHGQCLLAVALFEEMKDKGLNPDRFTYSCILKACGNRKTLKQGREIHERIIICMFESDKVICSTLIDMYVKCGNLEDACKVFESISIKDDVLWSTMITGYVQHGNGHLALDLFEKMKKENQHPDKVIYCSLIKACAIIGGVEKGRILHRNIIRDVQEREEAICNSLIDMYSKCGCIADAEKVFQGMAIRSDVSWNTMIAAYTEHGKCDLSIQLFHKMAENGIFRDNVSMATTLKACSSSRALQDGRLIHSYVSKIAMESDTMVHNTLIDMYANCGKLDDAFNIFDRKLPRDVVSWNAIIGGYTQHGHPQDALVLFSEMIQDTHVNVDKITFSSILNSCADLRAIKESFLVNSLILECNVDKEIVVGSALVDMYCKCGALEEAERIFSKIPNRNVVSWNSIITGYTQEGWGFCALKKFEDMEAHDVKADSVTFLAVLRACGMIRAAAEGRWIHHQIIFSGCNTDELVGNALIDMYVKCASLEEALCVFDKLPKRDVASWNIIIGGYTGRETGLIALKLFHKMQEEDVKPDHITFLCIIKACASLKAIDDGKLFHTCIIKLGLEKIAAINGALLDMYACFGLLEEAQKVFQNLQSHDIVSCNEMIAGYVDNGHTVSALNIFKDMKQEGIQPDKITFSNILRACQCVEALEEGRIIHYQITRSTASMDDVVGSTLIDMYVKCGSLTEARQVFDEWPSRDMIMWSAMIGGYVSHGLCLAAVELFSCMLQEGLKPDIIIFACILKACGTIGVFTHGQMIHDEIIEAGLELDASIQTSLIYMYANFGSLEEATKVFNSSSISSVESWTAMISGYAKQGNYGKVRKYIDNMQLWGWKPDEKTYTSILAGCSHVAEVTEGSWHLQSMLKNYGIMPGIQHFNCMIDLLGRVGRLDEAEKMLKCMPSSMTIVGWVSLLMACRTFGNNRLGKVCFNKLVQLNPNDATGYMLMLNIYADMVYDNARELEESKRRSQKTQKVCFEVNECTIPDKKPHASSLETAIKSLGYISGLDGIPDSMIHKCNLFDECEIKTKSYGQ